MFDKITRGTYGYIDYKKKSNLIKAAILALIIILFAVIGIIIYGNLKNLFMLPSLLTVIPFANFAASYFAMVKFKTADIELYSMLKNYDDAGMLMSDLIIVDADGKRYGCDFAVFYKGGIVGYSSTTTDLKYKPESHINDTLKKRGVNLRFKIYNDFNDFLKRINGVEAAISDAEERSIELAKETFINSSM